MRSFANKYFPVAILVLLPILSFAIPVTWAAVANTQIAATVQATAVESARNVGWSAQTPVTYEFEGVQYTGFAHEELVTGESTPVTILADGTVVDWISTSDAVIWFSFLAALVAVAEVTAAMALRYSPLARARRIEYYEQYQSSPIYCRA